MKIDIQLGTESDLKEYFSLSYPVQQKLEKDGIRQYVPSAHEEYRESFFEKLKSKEFFAVRFERHIVAGFCLSESPSEWWKDRRRSSVYLSNLVIREEFQGMGIGKKVLEFCHSFCARRAKKKVRIDCYAGNVWLCGYYEKLGFVLTGKVKQHIDYWGHLYELTIEQDA